ncbi:MAG: ComEC family competence protein [Prevotellaceae bacterium]|jgi:competence protein ComEC|nr:ComEC family competence protein [Prevotellaceae bacterium]
MRTSEIVERFRTAPFVRLMLPMSAGIIFQAELFPLKLNAVWLCATCFALMLPVHYRVAAYGWRWCFGLTANLFLFFVGVAVTQNVKLKGELPIGESIYIAAIVDDDPSQSPKFAKVSVTVTAYSDSTGMWREVGERMTLYLRSDSSSMEALPLLGDKLVARVKPNANPPAKNPYEFDYGAYLRKHGVFSAAFIDAGSCAVVSHNNLPVWKTAPKNVRKKLLAYFARQGVAGEELAVLQALTLGDKSRLDADLRQSYAAAGAMHILAVSGLHVGIISMVLGFLLKFLDRQKHGKILRGVIVLLCMWSYALVAGLSPSVQRATIMFTVLTVGNMFSRTTNTYNTLAFSAFLICAFDPLSLFDAGFQLSYAAVLTILFFQPRIYRLLHFKRYLSDAVWSLVSVSLAANIGTFPISVYLFHQFPLHFLITNILVNIPTMLIMAGFVLTLPFAFISAIPYAGWLTATFTSLCVKLLNFLIRFVESLPYALIEALWITPLQTWLMLFAILALSLYTWTKRAKLFMLSLSLMVVCLSLRVVDKHRQQQQAVMTVYSIRNTSLISFVSGSRGFALCDSANVHNPFNFNVKSHLTYLGFSGLTSLERIALQEASGRELAEQGICRGFVSFAGKTVKVLCNEPAVRPQLPVDVDYLILTSQCKLRPRQIAAMYRPQQVVIDASMPTYLARRQASDFLAMGIACHNVNEAGAFVCNF